MNLLCSLSDLRSDDFVGPLIGIVIGKAKQNLIIDFKGINTGNIEMKIGIEATRDRVRRESRKQAILISSVDRYMMEYQVTRRLNIIWFGMI